MKFKGLDGGIYKLEIVCIPSIKGISEQLAKLF